MNTDEMIDQITGLKRRTRLLEEQNKKMTEAIRFTLKTIAFCKDKTANPLAKMIDRERAEKMLAEAIPGAIEGAVP